MLGGVMETWLNKSSGELIDTFSIVTTRGNDVLAKIHNNPKLKEARMPLLIEDKDIKYWLNNSIKEVQKLIVPNITSALDYHAVQRLKGSKYLGNIPEVQEAHTYNELLEPPSLFS
jgi:putative SOS response-associated peptidase YedK